MSDQGQIVCDPEKGEVRAPDFTITAAGQTGDDGQILHIYRYEDRRSTEVASNGLFRTVLCIVAKTLGMLQQRSENCASVWRRRSPD